MLPHQKNKADLSSMTEEEKRLFSMYGKLPSKKDVLKNRLKERKYFDSGDYALSKAGKASDVGVTNIGSQHPLPENIPHIHNTSGTPTGTPGSGGTASGSPVKETSHLHSKSPMAEAPIEAEAAADDEKPVAEVVGEVGEREDVVEPVPGAAPIPSQG